MKKSAKLLALFLALLALITAVMPAAEATAATATTSPLPVIYIYGNTNAKLYDTSGKKVWPLSTSINTAISNNMSSLVNAAVRSYTSGRNWNILGDEIERIIKPLFDPIAMKADGTDARNLTVDQSTAKTNKTGKYTLTEYLFKYDMRLDPLVVAAQLRTYVNKVLAATGKTKVNLIGRCMGAAVLSAYLTKYKSDTKVNTAVYYASGTNGVFIEEAPFSGEIYLTNNSMSNYVTNTGEESLSSLFQVITNIFGSSAVAGAANSLLQEAMPIIIPRILRICYASYPMYWALIGESHYQKAMDYIFPTTSLKTQYKGLIAKADNYHKNVMLKLNDTLTYLKNTKGVNINVIAKTNSSFDPIYEGSDADGDEWITTESQSFGATVALHGKKLSESYCDALEEANLGKYISSDRKIDASTCLFPDSTWFIKNMKHSNWTAVANPLIYAIFSKSTQVTVATFSNYGQFLRCYDDKLLNISNYKATKYSPVYTTASSPATYQYDGNNKTPTAVITAINGERLVKNTDYKVTYETPRSSIGTHYMKITYIGGYAGKAAEKINFTIKPANVTELKLSSAGVDNVKATWNKSAGASGYRIFKYDSTAKAWKKVADTTAASYTVKGLSKGANVKIAVKGLTKVNGKEYLSPSYVSQTAVLKPAAPTAKATAGAKSVTVSWGKIANASSYEVFRSTSKSGTYRRVATVTGTKYADNGLVANKTYYYKVRAAKKNGSNTIYSAYSAIVSAKTKVGNNTKPATVKIKATAGTKQVTITWSKASGATAYQIWRSTSKTGNYSRVATVTGTSYINKSLTTGKTYYYKVRAVNQNAKSTLYSTYSNIVSAKVK